MSDTEQRFEHGTPTWMLQSVRSGFGTVLLSLISLGLTAAPAFLLAVRYYPAAVPFIELTVVILAFPLSSRLVEEDADQQPFDVETTSISRSLALLAVIYILGAFTVSTTVGTIGVLSALVTQAAPSQIVAMLAPMLGATLDRAAAKYLDWSLGRIGLEVAILLIRVLFLVIGLSDELRRGPESTVRRVV